MTAQCENYDRCPKGLHSETIYDVKSNQLSIAFMGCWGTYCKMGETPDYNVPKIFPEDEENNYETKNVVYGSGYAANMLANYSDLVNLDAVVLAGDNVYSYGLTEEQKSELNTLTEETWKQSKPIKKAMYDMDKQFQDGFEGCMENVKTETFLVGVGNHDAESCDILNKQLNYTNPRWKMDGLSYTWNYRLSDGTRVNFIFIDTNIYENIYCNGDYPPEAAESQSKWLDDVLSRDRTQWNIVIGHIPFESNSHHKFNQEKAKKTKSSFRLEKALRKVIEMFSDRIDVYMCADEHNQQYITLPGMPPEVVSGSGGAVLDEFVRSESTIGEYSAKLQGYCKTPETEAAGVEPVLGDCIARPAFGFVGVDINASKMVLSYYGQFQEKRLPVFNAVILKDERSSR